MKKIVFLLAMGLLLLYCRPVDNPVIPSVSTGTVTDITTTTATCSGNVKADGGAAITARGVCWCTSENPTTSNFKTTENFAPKTKATDGAGLGSYIGNITGLSPNTTYYVRAYATNSVGTAYGEQRTFTTNEEQTPLSVTTGEVINITATTADCSGNVNSDGGNSIIARGVCWNTSHSPTILDSKTSNGTGLGSYTGNLTDLSPNTTYYVRAYVMNSEAIAYGEQKAFTTNQGMPSVVTGEVTNMTATTAICDGNVTADGGSSVTARGVCWSTSENPTTSNSKTTDGTGLGTYTSNITGLSHSTTYYVRAYATNSVGTAYGEQKTFTTNHEMPTVVTGEVTNITTTTAICDGNVTTDGGSAIIARGICWSTTENPTTSNTKTTNDTGLGTYTGNITGLSPNTTYYVRAYATNSQGTAYGDGKSFTTLFTDFEYSSFTDSRDDKVYITVTIGDQVWMAENLAYLPSVVGRARESYTDPYYYVYGYDGTSVTTAKATANYQTYGVLYNWPAAMASCPQGWHLPTDAEWTTLTTNLGGESVAGGKMKEVGTNHWEVPNEGATNESGFAALPGGCVNKSFYDIGYGGYFWSSAYDTSGGWYRSIINNNTTVARNRENMSFGFSVRCVQGHTLPIVNTGDVTNITESTANYSGYVISDGGTAVTARGVCWSTSENPTTSNSKTTDGTGLGAYTSNLTGLSPNTTYYVRTYATNSEGTAYGEQKSFRTYDTFTDSRDGHVYYSVTIGSQVWMAENLAYLPAVIPPSSGSYVEPYYYVYGYESANVSAAKATTNYNTYGVLYNWPAAMTACPEGWHLPSDAEWKQLEMYLGMTQEQADDTSWRGGTNNEAGKMREAGTAHWDSPNEDSTNESGFTALPGGYRNPSGFYMIGSRGRWWGSTENGTDSACSRSLDMGRNDVSRGFEDKDNGLSVRCVRD
ncbi:MAG: FISUMP domain-containing protein [Bacteroidales bacterium]|nr:FISUMP domain-containing protein [Bacteroidales bacterium]